MGNVTKMKDTTVIIEHKSRKKDWRGTGITLINENLQSLECDDKILGKIVSMGIKLNV